VQIELVPGDITEEHVDVIVNAANGSLLGGGGVDGAIHRRGGPAILTECRRLRSSSHQAGLPTGEAVATTAGDLAARWVVHTVGPVWSASQDRAHLLRACYQNSLAVADGLAAESIAFPLISAGVYGWPMDDAVRHALEMIGSAEPVHLNVARLVLFGDAAYEQARQVHRRLNG
jgi:O-acetyl-ADP-ribose deacetylase